jgi:uncharacterized membrane protein
MKRTREDNTVSVIQRAVRHFRLPILRSTVKEALKSHSNYPTFKSICDTFNEWNIEHYPLKYQPEEIMEISAPYIVHFKSGGGHIGFVSEIKNDRITYYESYRSKKEITSKDYLERCSGAVILINPDERSGEKDYRSKWQNELISNAILPVTILAFLLLIIFGSVSSFISGEPLSDKISLLLFLSKSTGILLSVLLILHEFEVHMLLTDKLCHLNKATNCNTVLNDKASKVFGWFGWADVGFVYFTGGFLFLLLNLNEQSLSLLAILSALSVPYPLFSIYYQGFVLKKWCPMCLGIQLILIIEFILLLPLFSQFSFAFNTLSNLFLIFLFTGIIYTLFILFTREKMSNEMHYYKYLGFKKNPDILRTLMYDQMHYDILVTETSLVFGDKDAKLKITAFLSLHCSHCARAFEKIRYMLKNEEDILINLVLMTSDNKMLTTLYNYQRAGEDKESLRLLDQWFNADPFSRTKVTDGLCIPEDSDISGKVNEANGRLFKECNVLGTPAFFFNGYKLPNQYDIDDIRYFKEFFKGKEEVSIKADTVN